MSQSTVEGRLSSFAYGASVFGVVASFLGLSKLLDHCKKARHYVTRSQDEVAVTRQVVEGKEAEMSSLRRTLTDTRADGRAKDEALTIIRKDMDRMKEHLTQLEKQLERSREKNQTLGNQLKNQANEARMLKGESQQIKLKHAQTLELLETRTSELKGAQAFLTKADSLSGADIIGMIEALNSEILQTAAFMAESFEFDEQKAGAGEESEELQEACASVAELLGPRLVQLLRSMDHHEDPILIQIALQAGMSAFAEWLISSWYFENPQEEEFLTEIYVRVQESEDQAVSGRWRALTRTHVQRIAGDEPDLLSYFIDAFVNTLIIAGLKEGSSQLHETIMMRFSERIEIVVKGVLRLNKAIGEGITSCDLEATYVAPDAAFEPSTMDDTFGNDLSKGKGNPEQILCTTDLGLHRIERVRKSESQEIIWQEASMLKPKIVLQSGLDEMRTAEGTT